MDMIEMLSPLYERLELTGGQRRGEHLSAVPTLLGVPKMMEAPDDGQSRLFAGEPQEEAALWQWLEERDHALFGVPHPRRTERGEDFLLELETVQEIREAKGSPITRRSIHFRVGHDDPMRRARINHCTAEEWGCAQLLRTGPQSFNAELMSQSYRLGLRFSDLRLVRISPRAGDRTLSTTEEEHVFTHLGITSIPPHQRDAERLRRAMKGTQR